jgi:hypothetical protein
MAPSTMARLELPADLERKRIVSVKQAAEFKNISVDTFKRHYSHLIKDLSPRRRGVVLGDVIDSAD